MQKDQQVLERTRGVKPRDPAVQLARVIAAVRELEKIGAAFTVAEVAERAGVSRATIYRSSDLRAAVGAKGDPLRPVHPAVHAKVTARHEALKSKVRGLRRELAEAEQGWEEMRERAVQAEQRLAAAERKAAAASGRVNNSQGHHSASLAAVAARLGPEAMRRARRELARGLHPDLFAQDSAAAALATELLKTLNALAEQ